LTCDLRGIIKIYLKKAATCIHIYNKQTGRLSHVLIGYYRHINYVGNS